MNTNVWYFTILWGRFYHILEWLKHSQTWVHIWCVLLFIVHILWGPWGKPRREWGCPHFGSTRQIFDVDTTPLETPPYNYFIVLVSCDTHPGPTLVYYNVSFLIWARFMLFCARVLGEGVVWNGTPFPPWKPTISLMLKSLTLSQLL